jgi:outer membrane protein assembly factor BamA
MNQPLIATIIAGMLACGLSACVLVKTNGSLDGRSISSIQIRYVGKRTIGEDRIRSFISTKQGDKLTPEMIESDMMSLYESGLVDDVRFIAEPDGDTVRLIVEVSPHGSGPPLCIGNTVFSDRRLSDASGITKDRTITVESLETARNSLREYYVNHGYVNAEVACRAFNGGDPTPEDYIFVVEEGSPPPQPAAETEAQQDGTSNGG